MLVNDAAGLEWVMQKLRRNVLGSPEQLEALWVVLHLLWSQHHQAIWAVCTYLQGVSARHSMIQPRTLQGCPA